MNNNNNPKHINNCSLSPKRTNINLCLKWEDHVTKQASYVRH